MIAHTYRRKFTECQAIQWTGDNAAELEEFTGGRFTEIDLEDRDDDATGDLLESKHSSHVRVYPGNWIVHEGTGSRVMDDQSFTEEYAPPVHPPIADRLSDDQFAELQHAIPWPYVGGSLDDPEISDWARSWIGPDGGALALLAELARERRLNGSGE